MKHLAVIAVSAAMFTLAAPESADAGAIQRACNGSDRQAATPKLCRCIQKVANQSLSNSDQRRASKFFRDPHLAQEVRASDRSSDEAFWKRYKAFGQQARKACG